MPIPAVIENHDLRLAPPDSWDKKASGHCATLAIRREEVGGVMFMRSAWEVESAEVLRLLCGAKMTLGVSGVRHPVVNLEVDALPADFQPAFTVRRFNSAAGAPMVRVETMRVHNGTSYRLFSELALDQGGLGLAVGQAIDQIEDMARSNGWGGE